MWVTCGMGTRLLIVVCILTHCSEDLLSIRCSLRPFTSPLKRSAGPFSRQLWTFPVSSVRWGGRGGVSIQRVRGWGGYSLTQWRMQGLHCKSNNQRWEWHSPTFFIKYWRWMDGRISMIHKFKPFFFVYNLLRALFMYPRSQTHDVPVIRRWLGIGTQRREMCLGISTVFYNWTDFFDNSRKAWFREGSLVLKRAALVSHELYTKEKRGKKINPCALGYRG